MEKVKDNGGTAGAADAAGPIPLYFNPAAGNSGRALARLQDDARIRLEPVSPKELESIIKRAAGQGTRRVMVGGGDGTIALAAAHLAGKTTELAIMPCGTLNHFAQRVGLPVDPVQALEVALHGRAWPVDAGYVNEVLFINTSSVGAYPVFVRSRKYLQHRMHYFPASIVAGFRRLLKFRRIRVRLAGKQLRTPLVFIGVGERRLELPALGQVKKQGRKGLHLLAVECDNTFEACILVMRSLLFGVDPLRKERRIENQLVDAVDLNFHQRKHRVHVAVDGELVWLRAPLHYRFAPGELMVAMPGELKKNR